VTDTKAAGQPPTPDEIRSKAVAVVIEHLKPVTYRCCDECESSLSPELMVDGLVEPAALVDALAEAGLLPTEWKELGE
jgi:hypothetical protein